MQKRRPVFFNLPHIQLPVAVCPTDAFKAFTPDAERWGEVKHKLRLLARDATFEQP
jgi:hypothetical protein